MTVANPLPKTRRKADHTLWYLLLCALFLVMEIAGGSSYEFSALVAVYVGTTILAVRCLGGMGSMFGAVAFWFALQHVLFSQVAKVALGEAPDGRLLRPIPTIVTEILLMLGFAAAGVVAGKIRPNRDRPLFPPVTDVPNLKKMAGAALILSVLRSVGMIALGGAGASLLNTLGIFNSLAVSAAAAVTLQQSGGKRLFGPIVWANLIPVFFLSIVGGNRTGFVFPVIGLAITGWAFGYRFRFWHYAVATIAGLFMIFILSPFSLAVRGQSRTGNFAADANIATDLLLDVVQHPGRYQVSTAYQLKDVQPETLNQNYFLIPPGNGSNVLNRFALIKANDLIVDVTIKSGTTGWANIAPGLPRLLPSFLTSDKTLGATGNTLAHRVKGMVGDTDYTTGITIGPTADAFSAFGYWGAFLLAVGIMLAIVVTHKFVMRLDMRRNVYAIAFVVPIAHAFSESTILNEFSLSTYGLAIWVFALLILAATMKLLDFRYLRPSRLPSRPEAVDRGFGTRNRNAG